MRACVRAHIYVASSAVIDDTFTYIAFILPPLSVPFIYHTTHETHVISAAQ